MLSMRAAAGVRFGAARGCAALAAARGSGGPRPRDRHDARVGRSSRTAEPTTIEIVTDATALVEKLEAVGRPARRAADSDCRPRLASAARRLRRDVSPAGEDRVRRRRRSVRRSPIPSRPADRRASAALATIRLTGEIPAGARALHLDATRWTFASYALTVRRRCVRERRSPNGWRAAQTSAPFALASPAPPLDRLGTAWRYLTLGFTHIVPARTGSHAVRARHLPAERSRPLRAVAGQRVHRRALDHARAEHVRRRRGVAARSSSR